MNFVLGISFDFKCIVFIFMDLCVLNTGLMNTKLWGRKGKQKLENEMQ